MTLETFDVKLTKQTLVSTGPYIYSRGGYNLSNDISKHNQDVWDRLAQNQCAWSQPVSSDVIKAAKAGHWKIHITKKALTENWLPKDIQGKKILCLASAGGQQAPVLAAAGADVTVFDISQQQLKQDRIVAARDELQLTTVQGDMRNLSQFDDMLFDIIIHPISNLYIPDLTELWKESYRVLKSGGVLLASFYNPVLFIFDRDDELTKQGLLRPKYILPYSDQSHLTEEEYQKKTSSGEAIVFGHTLSEQVGKQIDAGFSITGFYEDDHPSPRFLIEKYMKTMMATKAVKP